MTSIHTASTQPSTESPDGTAGEAVVELVPLDMPRDGVPAVINTDADLARAARALAAGTGPAAVDAERASGYRYGQRAFLVQIRREGSGTWLIDPEPFADLSIINDALDGAEWILHAANQDLTCLAEVGLHPERLFDTELAARLAGLPRVGLGPVVENLLGMHLAKEHSAADWSTRPLPEPWLRYAALDVEVLDVLREKLTEILVAGDKLAFAREEFEAVRTAGPSAPRTDPWRRTSGVHQLRDRRQLAAVKLLWEERESLAQNRDVAPGRLIPDSALVAAARAMPTTVPQMLKTPGFHGRAAAKEGPRWLRCISAARSAADLPPLQVPTNAPPPPRVWADKDPLAAARLNTAKERITRTAEAWDLPLENLLTPDYLRRICWTPPAQIDLDTVSAALRDLGAREWQIQLTAPVITVALLDPEPLPEKQQK
ncbi:HRDC domain-containing protein [Paeniglutamicibacter cryotolerans]|uniref:Ribonuclease D n=1 Tax=Paeniglutamicibacter cryotolerans TaxID=670079 RepID=A0A839QPM1_9MICC|nr:HRDC domain-containing protein [Paeniglutamicibacter cryotolerans]MBB2996714.1 ribonuclease D [Paeniglutamicibacter cryotolerans]